MLRIRRGLLLALSIRDFRLLWTGQLLSSLGSWLLLIAAPYKVFELTGSPAATGFAFVAESVPAVVIGPIAGVAVDRWDRRRTMLAVTLGQAGCILPLAFVHEAGEVAIAYLSLLAESALGQFYRPAEQALIPGLAGCGEGLTSANALMSLGDAATRLAGASAGGLAFAALGLPMTVAIDAGTYGAASGCLLLLRWRPVPHRVTPRHARSGVAEFREGLRHVGASGQLRRLLSAAAVFLAGNGAFTALLVPYIHRRLHGTAADVGFLVAATGAGFLAGAPIGRTLYHRLGLRPLTAASLLITAAAFATWFTMAALGPALLLAALTGMSAMVFLIARLTYLQQCTPGPVIGRTCSIFFAVEGAAGLAGTAIGGVLGAVAGFTPTVAAAAAAIAGAALISALPAMDFAAGSAASIESSSGSSARIAAWRGPLPEVMRRGMDVRGYINENAAGFFDALTQWLAIPSVSADPGHSGDVRRSAQWLAEHFRRVGFPVAEVWETGADDSGLPAVFAHWPAADPSAPVVLVYGHHDVQPAEPLDEWHSPPFEPAQRDGQLFARGVSDDKGQVLFHALAVQASLTAGQRDAPPVTLKLLVEGEEESGSTNFAQLLEARRDRLGCDVIVISDATMWAADVPSMTVGMRGCASADIDLRGPERDLHSGSFGGGVPNPLHAMAALLAGLHDGDGRVTLPGFYDDVVPVSAAEREMFARLPFDEQAWLDEAGHSRAAVGEAGFSTLERIWARPTAEVNGMWGGHIGPGGKTIIPSEAHAKLTFRLVANQEPADVGAALREYVTQNTPPGIEATVTITEPGTRPCFSPVDHPAVAAARRAMSAAFGQDVLFTREGGSGPEADLAAILGAPLVFLGVTVDSDRIHAPNERVEMALLLKGAEAAAYLWDELAAVADDLAAAR